jgi:hypothetical protein
VDNSAKLHDHRGEGCRERSVDQHVVRLTRRGRIVLATLACAAVVAAGFVALRLLAGSVVVRESCTATAGGTTARLDTEQAVNAATIAAVAARRGLPARAATIALATAMQESKLRNLDYGDRDSLGLFQQRPSQGWGTPEQIRNPAYAAGRFYDELVKIDGYRDLEITDAAQRVQRSGFPRAYADHEPQARALASALMGHSAAAFSCSVRPASYDPQRPGGSGLTPRAAAVLRELEEAFGAQRTGGYAPNGVRAGHIDGSAHYEGRAIDVFFRPVSARQRQRGWAVAQWLVAQSDRLGVATVIYDNRIWTARRSGQGWRAYQPPGGPTEDPTLRHEDHVHVDVIRGS